MTDRSSLGENELKALTYFVVGVSSEGSFGGRDVSNRLSFAGKFLDGKMFPVANSGLTIGTLQKDLGQDKRDTAKALVSSYQNWARAKQPDSALTEADELKAVDDLSRTGSDIKEQKNRGIDHSIKGRLDAFLRAEGGRNFVHQRDQAQVDRIYTEALRPLMKTSLYSNASDPERIEVATTIAKGFNQNEVITRGVLRSLEGRSGTAKVESVEAFRLLVEAEYNSYMKEGRSIALRGAEVFSRLQAANPDHPLHDAWKDVLSDPLVSPTALTADETALVFLAKYTTIKNLFLEPPNQRPSSTRWGRETTTAMGDHSLLPTVLPHRVSLFQGLTSFSGTLRGEVLHTSAGNGRKYHEMTLSAPRIRIHQ